MLHSNTFRQTVILIVKSHSGMLRFSPFSAFVFATLCLTALSGCGQKGPLYMPQQGKPAASPIRAIGPATQVTTDPVIAEPSSPAASPNSK
jgi:predicted small lipoprotein YifL